MSGTYKEKKSKKGIKKVFWGVLLLLGAAALVVGRLGYLEGIGLWSILFSVCLAGLLIDGLVRRSFGQMLFAVAFFIIVNDKLLKLEAITPWPVLGAALLGTVGLNLLFPRFRKKGGHMNVFFNGREYDGKHIVSEESWEGDNVRYENVFGSAVKYVSGQISHVEVENSFGTMQIYLTEAQPREGSASVHLETAFGSMVLYVPAGWRVVLSTENAFGSTRENGRCNPEGTTVLYVNGEVSFGSLLIRYV